MKILVVCQHYFPEPFRITDICEELAQLGHDVTVVTGTPNYPMGEIYPGYEKGKKSDEVLNGVKIHRCKIAPRKTGVVNRVRNYFSYASASKKYVKTLPGDFDVVFANQSSPVMMASAGLTYKKKYGKKLVLYCMDIWPECLCVGGIRRDSAVYNLFKKISGKIYSGADVLLVSSQLFRGYMTRMFGIDDSRIHYLPQHAESQFLSLEEKTPADTFELLFAGNIGAAQNLGTVIEAARLLQEEPVRFHIVGEGTELENLKSKAQGLSNVVFYGRKPLEEMPRYYAMADAMLITLTDDPVVSLTLPGKVQTYMAAGKPIVGAINGETALVLENAQGGYCGEAGNARLLADNILKLMASGKATQIGRSNKEFYLNNFSKEKFIHDLLAHLEPEAAPVGAVE